MEKINPAITLKELFKGFATKIILTSGITYMKIPMWFKVNADDIIIPYKNDLEISAINFMLSDIEEEFENFKYYKKLKIKTMNEKNVASADTVGTGRELVSFGTATAAMKQGKMVARVGWNGKGMFAFRQVPSNVPEAIVPNMSSLPQPVKDELVRRGGDLNYSNQMCLVKPDNTLNGWVPSAADILTADWVIL